MPVTPTQQRMWTGQLLAPSSPLYNMAFLWFIDGRLDPAQFDSALERVFQAHDALRLCFQGTGSTPVIQVLNQPEFAGNSVEHIDFSRASDPVAEARAWATRRTAIPYRLDHRLWRSALLNIGPDQSAWWLDVHHLIIDAASCERLFEQVSAAYSDSSYQPAASSYCDYIARVPSPEAFAAAQPRKAKHWQSLSMQPPPHWNAYGRNVERSGTHSTRVRLRLPTHLNEAIDWLAEPAQSRALSTPAGRAAVFAALLAAFLATISNESQQRIALLAGNRRSPGEQALVGCLIETAPFDVHVDPTDSLQTLINQAARELQTALRHAVPGSSHWEVPAPVVLNVLPYRFEHFAGLRTTTEWIHSGASDRTHQLRLQICHFAEHQGVELLLDLNHAAFDDAERARFAHQFGAFVATVLEATDTPLTRRLLDIAAVDAAERLQDQSSNAHRAELLARLIPSTASPTATAVRQSDRTLSFAQLVHASRVLAARLIADGIGPGHAVPVFMRPDMAAVVAIHAVLQTGAAFVPLDPNHPTQRLLGILDDLTQAFGSLPSALTHEDHEHHPFRTQPVSVEALLAADTATDAQNRAEEPRHAEQLCYVLYTSGSTGRPKGVKVPDRGLANYLHWASEYYANTTAIDMPLFTSLGFDATLTSLLLPTVTGGCVHVYPNQEGNEARVLSRILADDRVDLIKMTPAHLALVQHQPVTCQRVRGLILGGEVLERALALRIVNRWPVPLTLFNEYGPTETVIGCSVHRFDPAVDSLSTVSIGSAIDGARLRILDDRLQPVPLGVPGELCIGGIGVGLGYLNRDAETEARFVADPDRIDQILYRSGDRARWLDDGSLEFLGRIDRQIKLHGVRLELDEVAAVLSGHPAIDQAAVQLQRLATRDEERFCSRCGISSRYPDNPFDADGVCQACNRFDGYRDAVFRYFKPLPEFEQRMAGIRARRRGSHDCILLLSGGKDSTYVLYQLVAMGLDVLVFTLDNGFISDGAKANIRRVAEHLGVECWFETTPHMNDIFADSLARHSNVCNGCFKTIYTLSMKLAAERSIPAIVTGLARGQLFETRLADMSFAGDFDPDRIDETIADARRAYHSIPDAATRLLPVKHLRDGSIFDEVEIIDYFRYSDVTLSEMYQFLADHAPWIRPEDTGRSTNCLINDLGIYVHQRERGYHNYALPYGWDVRLGHKTRAAAMDELNDDIDEAKVQAMLNEIGYELGPQRTELSLTAYYVAANELSPRELRDWMAERLPAAMLPTHFVRLPELPLTHNGKIDYEALPKATRARARDQTPPRTALEKHLVALWQQRFELDTVGIHDDFFELGGDSVIAIQLVDAAAELRLDLEPRLLFEHPSIAELATKLEPGYPPQGSEGSEGPTSPVAEDAVSPRVSPADKTRALAALHARRRTR
ncbi:MAG: amino acid adenylation domain-containing protein [Pseudomonadota bacterium]